MPKITVQSNQKGQVLVIMAVSLLVLLIFIGLAIDGTQLFLNYTRLKRAVDAASIAAANDFKKGASLARMKSAALEILALHQVPNTVDIQIFMCDADGDGNRDDSLQTTVPAFYAMCPAPGQTLKKLIYLRAFDQSPTFFVHLVGIGTIPLTTTAVAEAAPVDLVIVLDTSESMGNLSPNYNATFPDFDPTTCNAYNDEARACRPLWDAKQAAKFLIDQLYPSYDRVAVVTFDVVALTRFSFSSPNNGDLAGAKNAIDTNVPLHDDPPVNKLFRSWNPGYNGLVNPVDPEDRDNNGLDDDPKSNPSSESTVCTITVSGGDRWDTSKNIPCDNKDYLDAFDWNQDNLFTAGTDGSGNCTAVPPTGDHCISLKWKQTHTPSGLILPPSKPLLPMSLVSTCSGCGIREATANLVNSGRPNAVWVIVFLSDGVANMSDTPSTFPYDSSTKLGIPANYPNGFCGGKIDVSGTGAGINYWKTNCIKWDKATRYCIDEWTDSTHNTCPRSNSSQTVITLTNPANGYSSPYTPPYSADDYARDMVDTAALRYSLNGNEPMGYDIAIYSVGFGDAVAFNTGAGESLLRYMAAVGDDGNRETDPCSSEPAKHSCGQYYFAQNPSDLLPAFQDIATRLYTKISE